MHNKAGVAIIMHSTVQIENVCKDCLFNVKAIERTNTIPDTRYPCHPLGESPLPRGVKIYIHISPLALT